MRILFFIILFFSIAIGYAQSVHLLKDKRFVQHWESMKDCSIREITENRQKGLILDGCLLQQTDKALITTIKSIIENDSVDTMAIECSVDVSDVVALEHLLLDLQGKNSEEFAIVLLNNGDFYRQYIGLSLLETKYLFVSFQRNETVFKSNWLQRKNYELFKLIYSRIFLFKHLDSTASKNDFFWLLYDPEKNIIISFYYN